jgi:mRNA interferase MazF
MVIAQGDIYWVDLGPPVGSGPGFRRPVVVVQNDSLNRSALGTAVCVLLTGNLRHAAARGNVLLPARGTGLPRDSVANVSQIFSIDKGLLEARAGRVSRRQLQLIFAGIDVVLGR